MKPSGAHISCVCRPDHPDKDGVSTVTQSQVKCADRREYTQGRPSTQARPASIDWRDATVRARHRRRHLRCLVLLSGAVKLDTQVSHPLFYFSPCLRGVET